MDADGEGDGGYLQLEDIVLRKRLSIPTAEGTGLCGTVPIYFPQAIFFRITSARERLWPHSSQVSSKGTKPCFVQKGRADEELPSSGFATTSMRMLCPPCTAICFSNRCSSKVSKTLWFKKENTIAKGTTKIKR